MGRDEQMVEAVGRIEEEFVEFLHPYITNYVYHYEGDLSFLHATNMIWSYVAGMILIAIIALYLVWHKEGCRELVKELSDDVLYPRLLRMCTEISLLSYRLRGRMPSSKKEQERLRRRICHILEEE